MRIIIFEDDGFRHLLPLVYWRTAGELRVGYGRLLDHALRHTAAEKMTVYCRPPLAAVTAETLDCPVNVAPDGEQTMLLNARLLLTGPLADGPAPAVQWVGQTPVAIHASADLLRTLTPEVLLDPAAIQQALAHLPRHTFVAEPRLIGYPWDLIHANPRMLELGWKWEGSPANVNGQFPNGVHLLNRDFIHVGEGSVIKPGVVLDAEHGPIYIGCHVIISANCSIEGPCYIGDGSLIQPGAVLRDAMSIGRRCKVGGELESSILHGFSNKQHDGFLGHSYVAEWVNLAADTVNSDLKNTYGTVRVPINGVEVDSGQMFVGLMIGDHSKTGIGQMFPTGAVVGFGSNVATCEFSPKFVPSFTWLTGSERLGYEPSRCLDVARRMMARRQVAITPAQEALFLAVAPMTAQFEVGSEDDDVLDAPLSL